MKQPRFQVYEARDGYRWRLLAANGRTIADSGEAYTRKRDAKRAVKTVEEAASKAWATARLPAMQENLNRMGYYWQSGVKYRDN